MAHLAGSRSSRIAGDEAGASVAYDAVSPRSFLDDRGADRVWSSPCQHPVLGTIARLQRCAHTTSNFSFRLVKFGDIHVRPPMPSAARATIRGITCQVVVDGPS